jgi:hypothetical protein
VNCEDENRGSQYEDEGECELLFEVGVDEEEGEGVGEN